MIKSMIIQYCENDNDNKTRFIKLQVLTQKAGFKILENIPCSKKENLKIKYKNWMESVW